MMQTNKIKRVEILLLSLLALVLAMSFAMSNAKTEATSSVVVGHEDATVNRLIVDSVDHGIRQ